MKPIEPIQQDGMPSAVATAMLTEPKARLTNRMRKVCNRARQKVFVSSSPIVWNQTGTVAGDVFRRYYSEHEAAHTEIKTERRFRTARLVQLRNWLRRAIARRAVVQRQYLAVPNSDVPHFQQRFDAARQALALMAERLDIIRDCAEDEIKRRAEQCGLVEASRHPFRSVVYFRPKATT